ncbi:Ribosomal RNA small subunit methyltransferase E [Piscirickettsia salmonis]|uniref:16S rRNA (uracil(1498)-N(3))-methyltransferase n=1 Tax=Piscirickettsia salmonis TaxID=1238 RepID=UPI0012BAD354|nr:16S rRNA (uracil(1498)-N(3))-methyltransferase [Piscirickettsia salmonis]QGP52672.1 Ribosomal RNA small subunit methyltransferase E [Piscirickettsia salmonis]QGP57526.1 Ribosomal RNA small subunit methyltransferase E [Piscirickettsia salmonis]QGP62240.1 Ribosomal RNA small subunit methyltransferase E [Piscirickettsia salmonis]
MRVVRLYTTAALTVNQNFILDEKSAHHAINVLRMQSGDTLHLFNGDGLEYHAVIQELSKKTVMVNVTDYQKVQNESPLNVHLGQVISRGDKMDFTIQKAVELGVNKITPLFSERCGVQLAGKRLEKKHEHWQQVAISACEQSGRVRVPIVHQPTGLKEWLNTDLAAHRLILHPHLSHCLNMDDSIDACALLVGSEGGFSEQEVLMAVQHGFHSFQLGPRILRTETAALTALAILQSRLGDL